MNRFRYKLASVASSVLVNCVVGSSQTAGLPACGEERIASFLINCLPTAILAFVC